MVVAKRREDRLVELVARRLDCLQLGAGFHSKTFLTQNVEETSGKGRNQILAHNEVARGVRPARKLVFEHLAGRVMAPND